MKILLIFSLWLFSGQVNCEDVTGYRKGSVIINWQYDRLKYMNHTKYFCKIKQNKCTNELISQIWAGKVKFMAVDDITTGLYSVLIRNISKQDAGAYRCGVEGELSIDVTLNVQEDPCCGTSLTQTAHQGHNITLNCTYPEQYKNDVKYVFRMANNSIHAVVTNVEQRKGKQRFSLLEETQVNMFSLEISNVTVEDGGLYLCGAQKKLDRSMTPYIPVFCEIQLHVTCSSGLSVPIIAVCVCVFLLLIGGSALMLYKLGFHKSQSSYFSTNRRNTINSNEVHHSPYYEDVSDYSQATSTTVYATTQKLKAPPTSPNSPAEPALDFYTVALLPLATADTSPVYATVHHGV
ncbi:polymeric immunoglobulin receptor-like isoform X2 [Brachyhypopomus gauderio]|uniref:polymeric immunoglobulin receptor-like isoform X2 n=1 Tax=Brachyhypopomus gauderio TaxID=698409 RepID=UPI004042D810